MTSRISEAARLFSEQPVDEIDTGNALELRVHDLLPLPWQWSAEGPITECERGFDATYFPTEIFRGHLLKTLIDETMSSLLRTVFSDLAFRIAHAKKLPKEGVYEHLVQYSTGFILNSERDEDIAFIRKGMLERLTIAQLIQEGKKQTKIDGETIVEQLEVILELLDNDMEYVGLASSFYENVVVEQEKLLTRLEQPKTGVKLLENAQNLGNIEEWRDNIPEKEAQVDLKLIKTVEKAKKLGVQFSKEVLPKVKQLMGKTSIFKSFQGKWIKNAAMISKKIQWLSSIAGVAGSLLKIRLEFASMMNKETRKAFRGLSKDHKIIIHNQKVIYARLNHIGKNLEQIAENQVQIEKRINAVMIAVIAMHEANMVAFARLTHEVTQVGKALTDLITGPAKLCREARLQLQNFPGFKPNFNRFISLEAFNLYCKQMEAYLREGLQKLPGLLMQPGIDDSAVAMREGSNSFFSHHQSLLRIYQKNSSKWGSQKQFEYLLFTPNNIEEVYAHEKQSKKRKPEQLPRWLQEKLGGSLETLVKTPYQLDRLIDLLKSAYSFHYFYGVKTPHNQVGLQILKDALVRVEVGIFQANLIAGSGLLPMLYKKKEHALLAPNPLLAHNYIIYAIHEICREKSSSVRDYGLAYHSQNIPELLQNLLGTDWNFIWDEQENKWMVEFADWYPPIPLPTPAEVLEGTLTKHPQMEELYQIRRKILHELAGYYAPDKGDYKAGLQVFTQLFQRTVQLKGEDHGSPRAKL